MRMRPAAPLAAALAALLLLAPPACLADIIRGRVARVHDGDTLTVRQDGRQVKVRLVDIDAPELAQPHGRDAREALEAMVLREAVTVRTTGNDRYRRVLGLVERERDGLDVNLELVRRGHAWAYSRSSLRHRSVEGLEAQARLARRGLWTEPDPERPSDWRRRNPRGD
ncbi:MAG: thermonuclease family protein [Betaproteobacteria bacterium]|jgi:micrococcal nuclease|nr:thermonuclease family protein [Betaproteobacteria bacterium]